MPDQDLGRYQMLWDCPFCGAEKLLGLDHRHCPGCGSPQDPTRRYFPPEGEEIAVEDHPYHGVDKVCPACATPNAAIAEFCGACGSPLDEAAAARKRAEHRTAEGSAYQGDSAEAADAERKAAEAADREQRIAAASGQAPPPPDAEEGKKKRGCAAPLGVVAVLVLLVVCAGICFWKKEAELTVSGHTWERSIAVEKLGTVTEEAWDDEVPKGARDVKCRTEDRGTEKVQDGETCETVRKDNGDGTFSKVEECKPKYKETATTDQRCSYTIEKWTTTRTDKKSGGLSDTPAWPTVKLAKSEREGERKENYVVQFKAADGESMSCSTSQQRWSSLPVGSRWTAEVGVVTDSVDCDSLKER